MELEDKIKVVIRKNNGEGKIVEYLEVPEKIKSNKSEKLDYLNYLAYERTKSHSNLRRIDVTHGEFRVKLKMEDGTEYKTLKLSDEGGSLLKQKIKWKE